MLVDVLEEVFASNLSKRLEIWHEAVPHFHQMCDPMNLLQDESWVRVGSYLDKGVVQQGTGGPSPLRFTLQAMGQEVLPLCAQLFRNGRFVAHSHFIHDLEVMLIFVPGSLNYTRNMSYLVI